MPMWFVKLRDVVWASVLAVVFTVVATLVAVFAPDAIGVSIPFALTGVTFALLAQRS